MTESTFVNYIQEPDVHDGIVVNEGEEEEEESHRQLEVMAREISSIELTEEFMPKDAIEELRNKFSFQGSKFTR